MKDGRVFHCSSKFVFFLLTSGLISYLILANKKDKDESPIIIEGSKHLSGLSKGNRTKDRGKKYFTARILHTVKGTSTFQLNRILLCGDIHQHPGPVAKRNIKYPCKDCGKSVRSNQDAILCSVCKIWLHAKCIGFTNVQFKYYLENPTVDWICEWCDFPFRDMDSLMYQDNEENLLDQGKISTTILTRNTSVNEYANISSNENDSQSHLVAPDIVTTRQKDSRGLMMCHLNVNSLQNKFEEIGWLINETKAHVVFLTETKIDASYPNSQFKINGYNMYRNDRKKGGGGIIAYFSSKLPTKRLKLNRKYNTFETLVVQSKLGRYESIVIGIYRPPKCVEKDYYIKLEEDLNDIISWASLQTELVVVTGDLNLNRLNTESREGKILKDVEDIHGFSCLIDKPTRITESSQTLLDIILTNKPELFDEHGVYDPGISDHAMVYGIMKERGTYHANKVISFRSYKNMVTDMFLQDINSAPWQVAEIFDTTDEQYDYWTMLLESIIDDHAPKKRMRVRAKDVPYMTNEWKHAIKEKRKFTKRYAKYPTEENLHQKKSWRNRAANLRRKAIKNYWSVTTENMNTNPRDFYKVFKPFLDSKSRHIDDTQIQLENGNNLIKNQTEVANLFADHFAKIACDIGDQKMFSLTEDELENHSSVLDIRNNKRIVNGPQFQFSKLKESEVEKSLALLKVNKSAGHDGISPKLLQIASKELAPSLTKIFNKCIEEESWPIEWKKGDWVPVYKKEDHKNVKNYRPVTVLPIVDKVFEQLLSEQVTQYIEPYLNNCLTAYRKRNSCMTTLLKLVEDWKYSLDNKNVVGVLSSDLSKAFDSLFPPLLLAKLKGYGFSESALGLFRSYFSERKNRVRIGREITSEWREIDRGCPQGSNFGPLIWNIYQNDLVYNIGNSNQLMMYADDHQVYTEGQTSDVVQDALADEGNAISRWYEQNMLRCNHDKFQSIRFGTQKQRNKELNINILNNSVKSTRQMNLLGVTIDDHLKFNTHIEELSKKVARKVGVIVRLRNLLPTKAKLRIYKTFILSQLTYCHVVWHFCKASDNRKVDRLQEKALRAIYLDKSSTYIKLLKRARLPTLNNRRLQDIAIIMYQVKNNLCPKYISDLFNSNNTGYNLRNSEDFVIPRTNTTTYGKHSIRYMGPVIWSKLPKAIKESKSINMFKRQIRKVDIQELLNEKCLNCPLCNN